jgi:hypothetical protein
VYHMRAMGGVLASTPGRPYGEVHFATLETVSWDHSMRSAEGKGNGSIHLFVGRMEPCCVDAEQWCLSIPAGEGSQTARADVEAAEHTVNHHTLVLNIRPKHALGRTLRMTHIVPKHWAFPAHLAFSHNPPLFFR